MHEYFVSKRKKKQKQNLTLSLAIVTKVIFLKGLFVSKTLREEKLLKGQISNHI